MRGATIRIFEFTMRVTAFLCAVLVFAASSHSTALAYFGATAYSARSTYTAAHFMLEWSVNGADTDSITDAGTYYITAKASDSSDAAGFGIVRIDLNGDGKTDGEYITDALDERGVSFVLTLQTDVDVTFISQWGEPSFYTGRVADVITDGESIVV